jgi:hypothetical protein
VILLHSLAEEIANCHRAYMEPMNEFELLTNSGPSSELGPASTTAHSCNASSPSYYLNLAT